MNKTPKGLAARRGSDRVSVLNQTGQVYHTSENFKTRLAKPPRWLTTVGRYQRVQENVRGLSKLPWKQVRRPIGQITRRGSTPLPESMKSGVSRAAHQASYSKIKFRSERAAWRSNHALRGCNSPGSIPEAGQANELWSRRSARPRSDRFDRKAETASLRAER